MSNYTIMKRGMKLLIHSQTSTSSHTLLGMWLFSHAGLKLIRVSKRIPRSQFKLYSIGTPEGLIYSDGK